MAGSTTARTAGSATDRGQVGDRVGGQIGDRATAIGSGNTTINRPEVNVNNVRANNVQNVSNTFAQSNRFGVAVNTNPYGGGYGGYGWNSGGYWNGYYGGAAWNAGWRSGYWGGYFNRPVGWYATAAPLGWLPSVAAASYVYSNPYYAAPAVSTTVVEQPVYNYSQPIATPPVEVSAPVDIPLTINVTGPQAPAATAPTQRRPRRPPRRWTSRPRTR